MAEMELENENVFVKNKTNLQSERGSRYIGLNKRPRNAVSCFSSCNNPSVSGPSGVLYSKQSFGDVGSFSLTALLPPRPLSSSTWLKLAQACSHPR